MEGYNITDDGIITSNDGGPVFQKLHKLLYGGNIPITRVIGFKITSAVAVQDTENMAERTSVCSEDLITIASRLSKLLFLDDKPQANLQSDFIGEVKLSDSKFIFAGDELEVISSLDILLHSLTPITLRIKLLKSTGYREPSDNFNHIINNSSTTGKSTFIPIPSSHTLLDFVSIVPPENINSNSVRVILRGGMKIEQLRRILQ